MKCIVDLGQGVLAGDMAGRAAYMSGLTVPSEASPRSFGLCRCRLVLGGCRFQSVFCPILLLLCL